jgi:2,4-dienoyl-CoA reductase-like NADH-dependent reductase (Old Yellow Enzyme family)
MRDAVDVLYGGSAENRGRPRVEILGDVRAVWPERLPLSIQLGVVEFDGSRRGGSHGCDVPRNTNVRTRPAEVRNE